MNESPRIVLEVLHGQVVPAAEQRVDPGRAVRRGELASQQVALAAPSFVGRHHLAVGRYLVPRQLDPPRPGVGVAPGHDAAPVRGGAHRHPAGVAEPDRPAPVRDDHVVDRSHPRVEGAVDVVDRPCAEQGQQRVEAEVAEDRRRVADGEPAASVAVDLEQWPPLGGQRLDGDRVGAAHRDGLLAAVDHVVEGLLEDVLVVRHRVGDRPGHLAGVREVLHARDAREGEAEDVDGVVRVVALRAAPARRRPETRRSGAGHRRSTACRTPCERRRRPRRCCRSCTPGRGTTAPRRRRARPARGGARAWPARSRRGGAGRGRRPAASTAPRSRARWSSRTSSGAGSDDAACSPAFTPSTYAETNARVSSSSPSNARRAVSTIRVCRAQVSQGSCGAPSTSAVVPVARRRWYSSCQERSRAVAQPCPWARSSTSEARMCGTPNASR